MGKISIFLAVFVVFIAVGSLYGQQKKKSPPKKSQPEQTIAVPDGGELIPQSMHAKAREMAISYWEKRLTKCGSQGAYYLANIGYTGHVGHPNKLINFVEVREPKISLSPRMQIRSRVDIMNGLEYVGYMELRGIKRDYVWDSNVQGRNFGRWGQFEEKNGVLSKIASVWFKIVNGAVMINQSLNDYFPVNCTDVATYTQNNEMMFAYTFLGWIKKVNLEGKCFPAFEKDNWYGGFVDCSFYNIGSQR